MARALRDARLVTRTAREKLTVRHAPYWWFIREGHHLGYRKGRREGGGTWIARYYVGKATGGTYIKKSLGRADDTHDADGVAILSYAHACAMAEEWFAARAATRAAPHGGSYTMANAVRDYLSWYAVHRRALRATANVATAHILPTMGDVECDALTTAQIRRWHEALASAAPLVRSSRGLPRTHLPIPSDADGKRSRKATANRVLTVLKAALNHAYHEDKVVSDQAWRRVKPFRDADAAKMRYLSTDESTRLVNACEPEFRQLVTAALLTGCRYGELTTMRCGDFNADAGTVSVRNSKSGKPRHIPLTDEGRALFGRVTAGRPGSDTMFLHSDGSVWTASQQSWRLKIAAKAAHVEDVTFHILRHSYGSALAMQGVPMGVIATVLGHADTRMTEKHYAHLAPSYVADTIRANLPVLGIVPPDTVTPLRGRR